ncbi:MAG: YkgJ family cysteine cluster protein [Desulfobacterales bacterium]|nr:YkgJ family cysteine cluster protein [Desulfobacterales bacterium]
MTSDIVGRGDLFTCRRCGECCKGYGGTYITENEIDNICRYLGLERNTFIERYCQVSGDRPVIAQGANRYCIFWDKLCIIHAVKPRMCRNWPFIESILVDPRNWQAMAASCPGMRAGVSDDQIQRCVSEFINKSC